MAKNSQIQNPEINNIYTKLINDLKMGKRPRLELGLEVTTEIEKNGLSKQTLAILCYSKKELPSMEERLIKYFFQVTDDLKMPALQAVEKHCIDPLLKNGKKVSAEVIKVLQSALSGKERDLQSYALDIISTLGHQKILFQKEMHLLVRSFRLIFSQKGRSLQKKAMEELKNFPKA